MLSAHKTDATRAAMALLLGLLAGNGASAADEKASVPVSVSVNHFAFDPKTLTIAAGTTVEWTNHDPEPHTVVAAGADRSFKSPPLDTDDTFSFVFTKPGTYTYYCSVHPHMSGTIIVQ